MGFREVSAGTDNDRQRLKMFELLTEQVKWFASRSLSGQSSSVKFPEETLVSLLEVSIDYINSARIGTGTNEVLQAGLHLAECARSSGTIEQDGSVTVLWTAVGFRTSQKSFRSFVDGGL
jgi:hypothetical protein